MDSLTFKRLVGEVTQGTRRLTERLEEAVDGDLDDDAVAAVVAEAKAKLRQYEAALAEFDGDDGKRGAFEEHFAEWITEIREGLAKLSAH